MIDKLVYWFFHCMINGGTMITKKCQYCNNDFDVYKGRESVAKFCSTSCAYKYRSIKPKSEKVCKCAECGKEFKVTKSQLGKFCSFKCYSLSKRNRENRVCLNCGNTFEVKKSIKSKCCSYSCRLEHQAENSVDRSFKDTARYKMLRSEVFIRDNFSCKECGDSDKTKLQIHHIIPVKEMAKEESKIIILLQML